MPSLIRWVEDLITETSRFAVSRDLPDYCDLNTVLRLTDDDRTRHPALKCPVCTGQRRWRLLLGVCRCRQFL
ncbi:hypothetical protein PL963_P300045 (plasmid) [Pseudomonas cerasi]|uniref:Uncharacterized protein n=1 Tax=Pseudomonas cerasi TaxID=1583341 RepID=A0A2K4W363_9PSED|nr:hypothetical protein PL963_P300045 [Pseudomonas cerasi]